MLVFIDESGDAGLQGKPGSSDFFVMVAVIFSERDEAAKCDKKISELRSTLSKSGNKEYKFNRCNREEREIFFSRVSQFKFQYVAFVVNKEALRGVGIDLKASFYRYTAKLLFDDARQYLTSATVILDRCGDREFRRQLEIHIKKNINTEGKSDVVAKLKLEASHSNNLLQLADMVAGAVARSLRNDKTDSTVDRGMILRKELLVKVWPNQ